MFYNQFGRHDLRLSAIGLGGHEYLPDGRSRGFNDFHDNAIKAGYIGAGFGGERRLELIRFCLERGINVFDATIDSEKDALGRNLQELAPSRPVCVQTRPEGLVYTYDPLNRGLADYPTLHDEVVRGLQLLRRPQLDFLNIAFMRDALDNDPQYLAKIAGNVARLKEAGIIRFAGLDTFSGQRTYLQGIAQGCFDLLFVNFNLADNAAQEQVLPAAQMAGMGIFVRECFMKGALFPMGEEVGLVDRSALAQTALRWCLTQPGVTVAMVGARDQEQMGRNLQALAGAEKAGELRPTDADLEITERLKASPRFQEYHQTRRARFLGTPAG